jgi:hypothetical protein
MKKYIFLPYLLSCIFCCVINAAESKVLVFPLDVTQLRYRQALDMKTLFDNCSFVVEIPQNTREDLIILINKKSVFQLKAIILVRQIWK